MKCLVDMVDVRNSDPTTASDKRASEGSLIRDDSVYCFDARGVYNMVSTLKSSVGHAASIVNPCRPATQHPELLPACNPFLRQQSPTSLLVVSVSSTPHRVNSCRDSGEVAKITRSILPHVLAR